MENPMNINAPLYAGGPVEKTRVCLVHSNDWSSASTIEITKDVSITTDISVLAALVQGQGPSKFKIFCGISTWVTGQLEGEMKGVEPWLPQHRWLTAPADEHNVFDIDDQELWPALLAQAVTLEVKEWF
jgi:putative transcriptional regulator